MMNEKNIIWFIVLLVSCGLIWAGGFYTGINQSNDRNRNRIIELERKFKSSQEQFESLNNEFREQNGRLQFALSGLRNIGNELQQSTNIIEETTTGLYGTIEKVRKLKDILEKIRNHWNTSINNSINIGNDDSN